MALSILDGNQSATTLSSVVTGGEHIVAHSVVSLGSNAISNIATAVSGSTVCVGNLGLLQSTVATEGLPASGSFIKIGGHTGTSTTGNIVHVSAVGALRVDGSVYTQPVSIASVTIGNTVTIAGTVTANPTGTQTIAGTVTANVGNIESIIGNNYQSLYNLLDDLAPNVTINGAPSIGGTQPISGTVTVGNSVTISSLPSLVAGTAQIGVVTIGNIRRAGDNAISQLSTEAGSNYLLTVVMPGTSQIGSVTASISNSVTIASLPAINGTVTANLSISATVITSGSFASLTSATLVPGNVARKMATVYNLGAGQLFINAGATATTLGGGFMVALSSGDFYECDYTTTTLSAIFATAGTASWMSH